MFGEIALRTVNGLNEVVAVSVEEVLILVPAGLRLVADM